MAVSLQLVGMSYLSKGCPVGCGRLMEGSLEGTSQAGTIAKANSLRDFGHIKRGGAQQRLGTFQA